jgi:hypothetical protein
MSRRRTVRPRVAALLLGLAAASAAGAERRAGTSAGTAAAEARGACAALSAPQSNTAGESSHALLDAEIRLPDGPVLRSGSRRVALRLVNPASESVAGSCRVLPTAAWQVQPGRAFSFRVAPGETLQQVIEVSLPRFASPGAYELVLGVEVGGEELGVLQSQWVRPFDWLLLGPLAQPAGEKALAPEQGLNLDVCVPGLNGPVGWQRVPDTAYSAAGKLELDSVFDRGAGAQCACAFTVFTAGDSRWVRWTAPGAERVLLNGVRLRPGQRVWLERGKNTVLARTCTDGAPWSLDFALVDDAGAPVQDLDNDLARLLPGFQGWHDTGGPAHRVVTLSYRNAAARHVEVLGTFNSWTPAALQRGPGGAWLRDLLLQPGRYAYKLRVDGQLLPDPAAPQHESDGFGGENSLLIVK